MTKKHLMATIVMCIMMLSFSLAISAQDETGIERGMKKDVVRKILGSPKITSYISTGEIWQYLTGTSSLSTSPEAKKIIVEFDKDQRVVAYVVKPGTDRTLTFDHEKLKEELSRVPRGYGNNRNNYNNSYRNNNNCGYGYHHRYMSDADFAVFYDSVKKATFASDKLKVVEVAGLGSRISCEQCARILGLFTFGSDKMKALKAMGSRIADPENAVVIYKQFTFSSEKDKAAEIISNSRR